MRITVFFVLLFVATLALGTSGQRAIAQSPPSQAQPVAAVTEAQSGAVNNDLPSTTVAKDGAAPSQDVQGQQELQQIRVPVMVFGQPIEFIFLLVAAVLALVAFAILLLVNWHGGLTAEFSRTFMMITIIFAALFLIPAGYSSQQAAPVYGLLGSIAGYLFGKSSGPTRGRGRPAQGAHDGTGDEEA